MKKFEPVQGRSIPMNRADVDTDQIISKEFLKRIERTGFGPFAFDDWKNDPDFVLNNPEFKGAPIMVTGPNFGCGSSREHAPWALEDLGLKAIIAPSFADIFFSNCFKNGVLPIVASSEIVDQLFRECAAQQGYRLRVDLETQTVRNPAGEWFQFDITPHRKHCLLNGLDEIGLTLQHADEIKTFEAKHRVAQPWLFA